MCSCGVADRENKRSRILTTVGLELSNSRSVGVGVIPLRKTSEDLPEAPEIGLQSTTYDSTRWE